MPLKFAIRNATNRIAFALAAVLGSACAASADPIFDNGAPDMLHGSGREMTSWMQADDFVLSAPAQITEASFDWFTTGGLSNWDGSLTWTIFADSGANSPGAMIASGGGLNVLTEWQGSSNFDRYTTSFELNAPVDLAGGTKYWFALHLADDFSQRRDLYWADSASQQLSYSWEALGGLASNWNSTSFSDRSFSFVPAPGAAGLAMVGAALIGRRRRA